MSDDAAVKYVNMKRMVSEELGVNFGEHLSYEQFLNGVRLVLLPVAEFVERRDIDRLAALDWTWSTHFTPEASTFKDALATRLHTNDTFTDKFWRYLEYFILVSVQSPFSNVA